MAASTDKTYFLLTMIKGDNARPVREWIDDYHGHEDISTMTDIEECLASGFVTIGEDKIARLSPEGATWLEQHKD